MRPATLVGSSSSNTEQRDLFPCVFRKFVNFGIIKSKLVSLSLYRNQITRHEILRNKRRDNKIIISSSSCAPVTFFVNLYSGSLCACQLERHEVTGASDVSFRSPPPSTQIPHRQREKIYST